MEVQEDKDALVPGMVLEFFETREILLGVCLTVKNRRLTILAENNRELNLARTRIIHHNRVPLKLPMSREEIIARLAKIKAIRTKLCEEIDSEELWSLLEGETQGYSAEELAELVFTDRPTDDHVAALQRVLLQDRIHFQYKDGRFFARTAEKVKERMEEAKREAERKALLEAGSSWLSAVWNQKRDQAPEDDRERNFRKRIIEVLKEFYLFGQEAEDQSLAKEILKRAKLSPVPQTVFRLLVKLGVWKEDENTYLYQQGISTQFSKEVLDKIREYERKMLQTLSGNQNRKDLRELETITIDGELTRDYDDAISLREVGPEYYEVGVHIADVAAIVEPEDPVDREARSRASSIYLPDQRIPMLPPEISEDMCSLRANSDRLAVSFFFLMDKMGNIHESRIECSIIRVHRQLTYEEFDQQLIHRPDYQVLLSLAQALRQKRVEQGAMIILLPEIYLRVDEHGMIEIKCHMKETPSQIVVSELMIAANAIAARFLAERDIPSIYRSQEESRVETDQVQSNYPLFHIYRQKRLFSRAILDVRPARHSGLGIAYYTSITSPIRRYIDLVSQRQLKHVLTCGRNLYKEEELRRIITEYSASLSRINIVQRKWTRYWLLKYFEQEDIQALDAIVLDRNPRFAHLLLPDFLMEINMPVQENSPIRPGEMVRIKITKLNPREDTIHVQPA